MSVCFPLRQTLIHLFWLPWLSLDFPILISVSSSYFTCMYVSFPASCFFHNQCLNLLPITGLTSPSLSHFSLHRFFRSDTQSLTLLLCISIIILPQFCMFFPCRWWEHREQEKKPAAQLTASVPYARDLCFGSVTTPWSLLAFGFPVQIIRISFLLLLQALTCCVVQLKCLSLPHGWGSNT